MPKVPVTNRCGRSASARLSQLVDQEAVGIERQRECDRRAFAGIEKLEGWIGRWGPDGSHTSPAAARSTSEQRPADRPIATHRRRSAARARLCKEAGAHPLLLLAPGDPPVAKSCMATEMATVRFIRAAGYFCCPDFS